VGNVASSRRFGALAASFGGFRAYADAPSDAAVQAMLQERAGKDRESTGIVAVVSDGAGSRLFAYGAPGTPDNGKLDGDTVFEIGSITKVLTALILADMAERSEVAMTDPVVKYLPASVKVPEYQGKPITLLDLATYTSGLPNMPDNFAPKDPLNPFADYTVDQLYAFLSGYTLKYEPGTHYEYANLGFGLLGHALARRAGKSYEALLVERICDPLDLRSTRITMTEGMQSRLAQGHNRRLEPAPLWDFPTLAGCGAVRSTANDLTVFLEACLGRRQTPLEPLLRRLLETRRPTGIPGHEMGLGWFVFQQSWRRDCLEVGSDRRLSHIHRLLDKQPSGLDRPIEFFSPRSQRSRIGFDQPGFPSESDRGPFSPAETATADHAFSGGPRRLCRHVYRLAGGRGHSPCRGPGARIAVVRPGHRRE
jgi:serine-type D-Ala-D-Ala carboxypeptidase/endopeptidase